MRASLTVALLLALAACEPATAPTPVAPLDSAALAELGSGEYASQRRTVAGAYIGWAGGIRFPLIPLTFAPESPPTASVSVTAAMPGWSLGFDTGCGPVITGVDGSGVTKDEDNDGIADDYRIDFGDDCRYTSGEGITIIRSGSVHFEDLPVGLFAARNTADHVRREARYPLPMVRTVTLLDGVEELYATPTGMTHTMSYELVESYQQLPRIPWVRQMSHQENSSFTPDPGGVIAVLDPIPSGQVTFTILKSFDFLAQTAARFRHVDLTLTTPVPLHVDPTCTSIFDGGVIHGVVDGDPDVGFDVTISGCAAPVITVFGAEK